MFADFDTLKILGNSMAVATVMVAAALLCCTGITAGDGCLAYIQPGAALKPVLLSSFGMGRSVCPTLRKYQDVAGAIPNTIVEDDRAQRSPLASMLGFFQSLLSGAVEVDEVKRMGIVVRTGVRSMPSSEPEAKNRSPNKVWLSDCLRSCCIPPSYIFVVAQTYEDLYFRLCILLRLRIGSSFSQNLLSLLSAANSACRLLSLT